MELLVLKPDFISDDIIDSFESLIWTDRHCGYGDFELYTPIDSVIFNTLLPDYYLWMKDSDHVMIVEDRQIKNDVEDGDHIVITGRSLEALLYRRIIWGQTILTGNFQDGILKILNENVINPTIQARKIDNFIFSASTDTRITSLTIDAQYNGEYVYDVIKALCSEKKIGFKVTLTENNMFEFKLYAGANRSYDQTANPYVIFSPSFENLTNSNYLESKRPLKTVGLVGGEGDGSARKMVPVEISSGGGTGLSRREIFIDASDISSTIDGGTLTETQYLAQLTQRGTEVLAENTAIKSFEGEAEINQSFKYGVNFFIGDTIQITSEYGVESSSKITEVVRSQDLNGITTLPTFEKIL